MRALDDLVRQGKVRYIGNSNFPAWRIAEAEYVARAMNVSRFVSCQDEYSLVVRDIEKDLLPAAQEYKLGLLPFFPLASGLLTGKYKRGAAAPDDTRFAKAPALRDRYVTPRNEDIVEKLQAFAKARGHTMLELAFSWLAARPQVASVIAGATRVEQVEQNVKAIGWALSAEEDRGDRRDHEVGAARSHARCLTCGRESLREAASLRKSREDEGHDRMRGPDRRTTGIARRAYVSINPTQRRSLGIVIRNRRIDGHIVRRQEPTAGYVCDFVCRERRLIVGKRNRRSCRRLRVKFMPIDLPVADAISREAVSASVRLTRNASCDSDVSCRSGPQDCLAPHASQSGTSPRKERGEVTRQITPPTPSSASPARCRETPSPPARARPGRTGRAARL